MTTIDIMMPFYGDVAMMQAAVRSVMAQDDPRWRLTVVDDDANPAVPEWFATIDDERVRYVKNPENLGVTGNFNRCLDLVEHELCTLIGCDDIMLPNYVGVVRGVYADHPEVGLIQPGVRVIDGDGNESKTLVDEAKRRIYTPKFDRRVELSGEELAVSLLRGDWLYFPSICWRTELVDGLRFRPELKVIQDLALLIEVVQRGAKLVADRSVAFEYRRHGASESSATAFDGSRFTEAGEFFTDVADRMAAHGWHRAARVARLHLSSRIFALTKLPQALRSRNGVKPLVQHAFGRN
jgi:glycosyltransferase involved in cell wall biosynthesis